MRAPTRRAIARVSARSAVERTLAIVRTESRAAYFRVARELLGIEIEVRIGAEAFGVRSSVAGMVHVVEAVKAPAAHIRTSRELILALLDGRLSVLEAILAGELDVRAEVRVLERIARAGSAFANGAMRAAGARAVLHDLRAAWTRVPAPAAAQNWRSIM